MNKGIIIASSGTMDAIAMAASAEGISVTRRYPDTISTLPPKEYILSEVHLKEIPNHKKIKTGAKPHGMGKSHYHIVNKQRKQKRFR